MSFQFARSAARLLFVTVWLLPLTPSNGAEPEPAFSLVEPEITLDPGAASGRGALLLKGENLDDKTIGKPIEDPTVLDTGLAPAGLKFDVHDLDQADKSRRWLLTTDINGLPNNVTQKRYLTFRFDGKTRTLPFTLTNKNPATFGWSVKGPSEISLPPGEPIEISVAVQGVGATNVGLLQSSLLEQSQKRALKGGWILCERRVDDPSTCAKALNLAPRSTQQLLLYPAKGSTLVGKYMGNVAIGASEKPEGETLAMTVYGTTDARRIAGVGMIFIGVILAWLLTVYLQNRLNRDQMLLPATILKNRFEALKKILDKQPVAGKTLEYPQTTKELDDSISALSAGRLENDGLLPRNIPNPFKPITSSTDAYMHRISEQNARFELLQQVVHNGFEEIWKAIPSGPTDTQWTAVTVAVSSADLISSTTPAPAINEVITKLQAALNKLHADLGTGGSAVSLAAKLTSKPPTSGQISTEIRTLSWIAWAVFALLTTALGTYVLVLSNLGFGTWTDFLFCLFWGFGLPVGGTQLAQATTATTSTALGFSIAKS